jgi:hypothetical protein
VKTSHLQLCDRVSTVREVVLQVNKQADANLQQALRGDPIDISILIAVELDPKIDYILCSMSVLCYPIPNTAMHFLRC